MCSSESLAHAVALPDGANNGLHAVMVRGRLEAAGSTPHGGEDIDWGPGTSKAPALRERPWIGAFDDAEAFVFPTFEGNYG